jgi:hypothetical protein
MARQSIASLSAQLEAALITIAQLQATPADTAPADQAPALVAATHTALGDGVDNVLGSKRFARPILELIHIEQDWRNDNEARRGLVLNHAECTLRARRWAFERRAYWAAQYDTVAMSSPEYVCSASGKWPVQFGDKVVGTYIAIY